MSGLNEAETGKSIFTWLLPDLLLVGIIGALLYSYIATVNPLKWLTLVLLLGLILMVALSAFYHLQAGKFEDTAIKKLRALYLLVGLFIFAFGFGGLCGFYPISTAPSFIALIWQYAYQVTFPMIVALIWALAFYFKCAERVDSLISS